MTNSTTTLRSLQTAVNELHAKVESNLKSAKEIAAEAGAKLIEAKSILKHGEFKPWIAENFCFGYRTAKRYMDVAQAKMTSVSLFDAATSINEVLEIGKEPKNLTQLERIALIQKLVQTDGLAADELDECFQALKCFAGGKDNEFINWYTYGLAVKTHAEEHGVDGLLNWKRDELDYGRTITHNEFLGSVYYAEYPNKFEKLREIFPDASMDQLGEITLQGVKSEAA